MEDKEQLLRICKFCAIIMSIYNTGTKFRIARITRIHKITELQKESKMRN